MARLESIHILLAYANHHNFKLQQMDVKSAFLNGPLSEDVYVRQPPGFEDQNVVMIKLSQLKHLKKPKLVARGGLPNA